MSPQLRAREDGAECPELSPTSTRHAPASTLVLGATGMLGHKMLQVLSARFDNVWATVREPLAGRPWEKWSAFRSGRIIENVDAQDGLALEQVLLDLRPAYTINCIGLVRQRTASTDPHSAIVLNSLLPHRIGQCVSAWGGRVIHFGTDCVFSGSRGNYSESDTADAVDLYGRTKYLGELPQTNALTLRTSFIGRELMNRGSLLERVLAHEAPLRGYRRAFWSGVTNIHLAEVVADLLVRRPHLTGTFHVAGQRMSKYDLLYMIAERWLPDITVLPDDAVVYDRSLNGGRFSTATGYVFPGWAALLEQIAADTTPYEHMDA
jgi:dTDP-4-dehydrorhamnose reductase